MKLCLASASPRRADLLKGAGIELTIRPADVDESPFKDEIPEEYVKRLAEAKASAVWNSGSELTVLAADTVVVFQGRILGKPEDEADAYRMLGLLSGSRHRVMTGFCVMTSDRKQTHCCETTVEFRKLQEKEIEGYIESGEPMDKAGAYGIQSGAAHMVKAIEGSYTNVVGLPMAEVLEVLREFAH